jgi:hypothetical protein
VRPVGDGGAGVGSRLSAGEWISALSGLVLLVSLFLAWEYRPVRYSTRSQTIMGWQSFGLVAALLALTALVPIVHGVVRFRGRSGLRSMVLLCAGAVAVTLVLFGTGTLGVGSSPAPGLYVGLLAGAGMSAGAVVHLWRLRPPSPGPPAGGTPAPPPS